MSIVFVHPEQDLNGNGRENIYLALQDGQYLGHAFAWPFENRHVTYERPWNVYFQVNPEPQQDGQLLAQVRDGLYTHAFARAMELRALQPQLRARVYSSAQTEEQLAYLVGRGLRDDDATVAMEASLHPAAEPPPLPVGARLEICDAATPEVLQAYLQGHNTFFVAQLDEEEFARHRQMPHFALYRLIQGNDTLAWAQVYQRDDAAHVETMFVSDAARGRGLGRLMLSQLLAVFARWGCARTTLEVWQRNRRAVALYESFGYQKVRNVFWFPGIDL